MALICDKQEMFLNIRLLHQPRKLRARGRKNRDKNASLAAKILVVTTTKTSDRFGGEVAVLEKRVIPLMHQHNRWNHDDHAQILVLSVLQELGDEKREKR